MFLWVESVVSSCFPQVCGSEKHCNQFNHVVIVQLKAMISKLEGDTQTDKTAGLALTSIESTGPTAAETRNTKKGWLTPALLTAASRLSCTRKNKQSQYSI